MAYLHRLHIPLPEDNTEVVHFSLQGLLPAGHSLALYTTWGTLSLLASKDNHPYLLNQLQFTTNEVSVLIPVIEAYPYYCPNEVLHASFQLRCVSETAISRSRQYLNEARDSGLWDQEMRPIRSVLSKARLKLRTFGLEISSVQETGYLLRSRDK